MKTECNKKVTRKTASQPVALSPLGRQQIVLDFAGGRITSDAGVLVLREVNGRLNLSRRIAACIKGPRDPDLIVHEQHTMIAQRMLAIACGWEDLNDQQELRKDPAWQIAAGRKVDGQQPLASPPTLCRLENRVDRAACVSLAKLMVEQFIESYPEPPQELILDFDATNDPIHGQQEGRFFHGYYDEYCYLPLYVFCGSRLVCAYLRRSNIDATHHAWALLGLLTRLLQQVWPKVRIIFRGDSGFCRWRMLRWCDRRNISYIIGVARNSVLESMAAGLMRQAEAQYQTTGVKQRLFESMEYGAETWDQKRRVIAKAEHSSEGPNPRFVVTNLSDEGQTLYDAVYCARGQAENYIKEQQLGLFADRTSCHNFAANQFRVLLSGFAYILVDDLRRNVLHGTELAAAQADTIRLKLFKIGAVIKASVRRLVLHLSEAYPLRELFILACRRLAALRPASPVQQMSG